MTNKEVDKILKELNEVRPEKLNKEAKRLFEAIMKIADQRDKAEADLYETNNRINDLLDIVKQKDKLIDDMVDWINVHEDPFENCHKNSISCADISCEECIKKYFEERCK